MTVYSSFSTNFLKFLRTLNTIISYITSSSSIFFLASYDKNASTGCFWSISFRVPEVKAWNESLMTESLRIILYFWLNSLSFSSRPYNNIHSMLSIYATSVGSFLLFELKLLKNLIKFDIVFCVKKLLLSSFSSYDWNTELKSLYRAFHNWLQDSFSSSE